MTELSSSNGHGNSDVVTLLVTTAVKPEYEQAFLDLVTPLIENVHANEPDTLLYTLTKHPTEPCTYIWVERYRDQDALQAHTQTSYIADLLSKVQDPEWWAKPVEILQLTQVVPE